ncbi:hypothetical protein D9M71_436870 [compost metagenome]
MRMNNLTDKRCRNSLLLCIVFIQRNAPSTKRLSCVEGTAVSRPSISKVIFLFFSFSTTCNGFAMRSMSSIDMCAYSWIRDLYWEFERSASSRAEIKAHQKAWKFSPSLVSKVSTPGSLLFGILLSIEPYSLGARRGRPIPLSIDSLKSRLLPVPFRPKI